MNLTRGELINFGNKAAETTSLKPQDSRTILNLAIQYMSTNFRFEHLKRSYPDPLKPGESFAFIPGQSSYDLPSDYGRMNAIKIQTINGFQSIIQSNEEEWFLDRENFEFNSQGIPTRFLLVDQLDEDQNPQNARKHKLLINRSPDKQYNVFLSYQKMPKWHNVMDSGTDGKTIPFDDNLLLQFYIYYAYEFITDKRANEQLMKANAACRDYLIFNTDFSVKQDKIDLDPTVYRRRTRRI